MNYLDLDFETEKQIHEFPVILTYETDGISVEYPAMPGFLSCADSEEEAISMAQDTARSWARNQLDCSDSRLVHTFIEPNEKDENQKILTIEVYA